MFSLIITLSSHSTFSARLWNPTKGTSKLSTQRRKSSEWDWKDFVSRFTFKRDEEIKFHFSDEKSFEGIAESAGREKFFIIMSSWSLEYLLLPTPTSLFFHFIVLCNEMQSTRYNVSGNGNNQMQHNGVGWWRLSFANDPAMKRLNNLFSWVLNEMKALRSDKNNRKRREELLQRVREL